MKIFYEKKEKIEKLIFYTGIVFILDFVFLITIRGGLNFGTLFPLVLGLMLISFSYIRKYLLYNLRKKDFKLIKNTSIILVSLWLVTFVIIQSFIVFNLHSDENKNINVVVVLGAGLKGDKLSLILKNRMDKCLKYMNKYPESIAVVSGGQGEGETITEAEAMKNFLLVNGINEKRILKEEKSTSTFENLKFSKKILENNKIYTKEIMIITSDFHLFRAKAIGKSIGIKTFGIPAKTPWYLIFNCYIREYFAIIKSLILNKYFEKL